MSVTTILLFFIYTYGLGFTITHFLKNSNNFLERNLIRVGIGIGAFVFLGIFLNLLKIPLDWKIFLVLSLIYPLFVLFKKIKLNELKKPRLKFRLTKSNVNVFIVLIIFFICLQMYVGGAFQYPYLENDDPWDHALSVKYVSLEKTVYEPKNFDFQYIDPYPPGYDLLIGVLHQTSPSLSWTLKFFNSLIISLGILFFYFFAKIFIGNKNKALFATFILALVPSYFTHFIWAISLAVMLFFPAMYCLEMIKRDRKWIYPAMIVISSILLVHPSLSIKLGIMFGIYWLVKAIIEKSLLKEILIAEIGGLLLSFVWWLGKWKSMFLLQVTASESITTSTTLFSKIQSIFSPTAGTATKAYSFNDFFIAKPFGGINIHLGWGIFATFLVFIGLIYCIIKYKKLFKKENVWMPITIVWFIFTFLGTNSATFNLPLGFYAFRFWLLLAIPVVLISSIGLWFLFKVGKKVSIPKLIILIIVVIGVLLTSGYQKYNQNYNTMWPPGVFWTSNEEIQGYVWLRTLPPDTKVFTYSTTDKPIIGFDKYSCEWCDNVIMFRENILDKNVSQLYSFLKNNDYEYIIISGMAYKSFGQKFGENKTKETITNLLNNIQDSIKFTVAYQTKGALILNVN